MLFMKSPAPQGTFYYQQELRQLLWEISNITEQTFQDFRNNRARHMESGRRKMVQIEERLRDLSSHLLKNGSGTGNLQDDYAIMQILKRIEQICYSLNKVMNATENKINERVMFSDKAVGELASVFNGLKDFSTNLQDFMLTGNELLRKHLTGQLALHNRDCSRFATEHEERMVKGVCLPRSSTVYLSMMDGLNDIFWHLGSIANHI